MKHKSYKVRWNRVLVAILIPIVFVFLIYFGIFALIFVVIWIIQFCIGRYNVRKMNEKLYQTKDNRNE